MQSEALGMPAPGRCLVSAWRRSWPLLWGGSPWDTRPYERTAAGRSTGHITDYGGAARLTGY